MTAAYPLYWPDGLPRTERRVASQFKTPLERAYRKLADARHPDKPGGSHDKMAELNRAREEARRAVG